MVVFQCYVKGKGAYICSNKVSTVIMTGSLPARRAGYEVLINGRVEPRGGWYHPVILFCS